MSIVPTAVNFKRKASACYVFGLLDILFMHRWLMEACSETMKTAVLAADLHALNNMLPGQALVVGSLASPEDLGGNDVVRALPLQLLFELRADLSAQSHGLWRDPSRQQTQAHAICLVVALLQGLTLMAWPMMVSALPVQQSVSQVSFTALIR